MSSLEKKIDDLHFRNSETERFVPYGSLDKLLTEDEIRTAVEESDIEVFRRDYITRVVLSGGKRVFAVLVSIDRLELIYNFIEHDNYSAAKLDDKLPLSKADLETIFGKVNIESELEEFKKSNADERKRRELQKRSRDVERWARHFEDKQYEYIAPSFQRKLTHRILDNRLRLPFKTKKPIGEGGFGDVYKVTLPLTQPEQPNSNMEQELVLKELKSVKSASSAFDAEQRCLEILRLIEHPNILEMYGSYTYRGRHNFLFPLAKGGDLQNFLSQDSRPPELESNESVYFSLCGLSSALESVHSYTHKGLNLEMIGCHHDLKPRNILVDGHTFILSDFGLSQMKGAAESSKTMFKSGEGYYLAPEAEDLKTFEKFVVSRPSDIWAFGCILAVTLTYLKRGKSGVEEFEKRRRVEVETIYGAPITFWTFHAGRQQRNQAVDVWLDDMDRTGTLAERKLILLVKDMLKIDPGQRPLVDECSQRLRFVALRAISESIEKTLPKMGHRGQLEFDVEEITFKTWLTTMDQTPDASRAVVQSESTFQQVFNILVKIQAELQNLQHTETAWYPLFVQLRYLNGQLISYLPKKIQNRIRSLVELEVLRSESDSKQLSLLNPQTTPGNRILILSSIKHMNTLASSSADKSLQLDVEAIEQIDNRSTFLVGKFRPTDATEDEQEEDIIIENREYDASWQGQDGKQLFERMENVLRLPETTGEFKALQCRGFCHDPTHHKFALVYRFPSGPDNKVVTQLIDVIKHTATGIVPYKGDRIVSLQDRFRLAYQLAEAVFEFHKIGWLHKSISSYNTIFFTKDEADARLVRSPFMTGFSHSRPNESHQISTAVTQIDERLNAYQHPEYQRSLSDPDGGHRTRYRAEFDYYSLGLVLLEIGYWTPLEKLRGKDDDPAKVEKKLLRLTLYLAGPMGGKYRDAVRACLKKGELSGDGPERVDVNFERLVLEKLKACSV